MKEKKKIVNCQLSIVNWWSLYRRKASSRDKWRRKRKLSIVNYQLSIDEASTGARQVPGINEDEKIIVNCQLSIVNWRSLYSRKASSMDKWRRKRKLSIVNSQLSIELFWWALSGGTKWSGRSVAVWAQRVCGAHSETKWRSSSADAALTSLVLSGSSQKERTITWPFGTFGSRQKYREKNQESLIN